MNDQRQTTGKPFAAFNLQLFPHGVGNISINNGCIYATFFKNISFFNYSCVSTATTGSFPFVCIALIEMVLVYKLDGKRRSMVYITTGVALVGLSFWLLNVPGNGAFIGLCMITLVTFGEIFSMPFMNSYWISRTQTTNRGQYAALYTMAWSAAQTLGPMGGSQLAEHFGFNVLWWVIGGLSLIAALSFYKLT